jgi:O-antigen/teichoic acid export membrane protein
MPPPRRPDPEPLETDDVRVVAIGTAIWVLALIATLVFHDRLADHGNGDWAWIALAGAFLGLLGLRYVRRRHRNGTPPATASRTDPDRGS